MKIQHGRPDEPVASALPFPREWLVTHPDKVEEILGAIPAEEQARICLQLDGKDRVEMLYRSPKGVEVVRLLAPQELYYMIKDVGEENCLPILSVASTDQLQYFFDLEWWHGDLFLPERALHWLRLLDDCNDPQFLNWFLTEEFDQKIMVLQSLVKVVKDDEMTNDRTGTENMTAFTIDGVYHIFVKVADADDALKKFFKLLRTEFEKVYFSTMEAVIWYPVTPTVERAYRWRQIRAGERGIPDLEEAMAVYARFDPQSLHSELPSPEDFSAGGVYRVAPQYPLAQLREGSFLARSLALLDDFSRFEALRWETVYLANKVMVADKRDPADINSHREVMRKVLGYVNIGLELAAKGDPENGRHLLGKTWTQSLFQAGHGRLAQLKRETEKLLREGGGFLDRIITDFDRDRLAGLVGAFPRIVDVASEGGALSWRDFESLDDAERVERFLGRIRFVARFCKQCLGVASENQLDAIRDGAEWHGRKPETDYVHLALTAFARFVLFGEPGCELLPEPAAQSFLQMVFNPEPDGAPRQPAEDRVRAFRDRLFREPLAWTPDDTAHLDWLLAECCACLRDHFGKINPHRRVEWQFTRGLLIKR